MAIIGQDTFIRPNQSGWGTASDGQVWTHTVGTSTLAIASNEGTSTNDNSLVQLMTLGNTSQLDTDVMVRFKWTANASVNAGIFLRAGGSNAANHYRCRYNGGNIGLRRLIGGVSTTLGTDTTFAALSIGAFYWIRLRATSATITTKIWADGSPEPLAWTQTVVDTSIKEAGGFGIYSQINNIIDTISFDSFTATDTLSTAPYPRYVPRGLGATIIPDVVTQPLAYIDRGVLSTIIYEIRTFIPRALGGTYIPETWKFIPRALGGTIIQSFDQLNDLSTRFRLKSADQFKDLSTRFILASGGGTQSIRDIATRFRLMQQSVRDLTTRFRLKSADQLKDIVTRFRLKSADQFKDISSRFRLKSANQLKDVQTRFRLMSANQLKDIATRFRLKSADQLKDISTRFILASASQRIKDLASRFRLMSANQLKDLASRFRLMSANQVKDVTSRFRLRSANQLKDIQSRFRVMSANQLRDISTRLRLKSANQLRDIASRFILHGVGTLSTRDLSTRFVLIVPSNATWITRDGLIRWLTRDDKAAWDTRDDLATWKTR